LLPTSLELTTRNPEETQRLGQALGALAEPGDIILLAGVLGAGKTCLTQGLARGLGIRETTPSPTFVLMREFAGRLPLYHMDFYRLEFNEIDDLGLDDYLYGRGVCVIEWADRGLAIMPAEHLLIDIEYRGENERWLRLRPRGAHYEALVERLKKTMAPAAEPLR
jgi:tRNA threonylcarbamoyladenosine biosynthesis protein TsaE